MLIQTSKYNFRQAAEIFGLKINAHEHTFELNTEFGRIFVWVSNDSVDTIYRYETCAWSKAPVNKRTSYQIRRTDLDHYVKIANVHNYPIQELMIVMALTECLLRYVTNDDYRLTNRDATNFIASAYMETEGVSAGCSPMNLAQNYMESVKSAGFFRPKSDATTMAFMLNFFKEVQKAYIEGRRKDEANFGEKTARDLQFGDEFMQKVFEHVYREMKLGRLKSDSDIAKRYREVCAFDKEVGVHSIPAGMRYVITGEK